MKKITLLAASLLLSFGMNAQIFYDGFEDYDDFAIDNIGDWTQLDLDGGATFGSNDLEFLNEGYTGTAIIFNPSQATPDAVGTDYDTFAGDKGLYFFASTTPPNDDWFISPMITLGLNSTLSLYAKSLTDQYGPDQFGIGVSTTGTNAGDFTMITPAPINPPTAWEFYEFDLSEFDGEDVYIAIHCTTDDGFILQIDEFTVDGDLSTQDNNITGFTQFYSAESKNLTIAANENLSNISMFNVLGQQVLSRNLSSNNEVINLSNLKDGVYIANVTAGGNTTTFKIVKR